MPDGILLIVARYLVEPAHRQHTDALAALCLTGNHRLFNFFEPVLYGLSGRGPNPCAMQWAAAKGRVYIMVRDLADSVGFLDQVQATPETLASTLCLEGEDDASPGTSAPRPARCLLLSDRPGGTVVEFAVYYYTYSTWSCFSRTCSSVHTKEARATAHGCWLKWQGRSGRSRGVASIGMSDRPICRPACCSNFPVLGTY